MRQTVLSPDDEPHLFIRSLAIDYDAGTRQASHSHAWPQLLYARQGAVRAEADGRYWIVPPRRALWIPAAIRHGLHISSRLQLRTLYVHPDTPGLPSRPGIIDVTGLLHEAILRICEQGSLDDRVAIDRSLGAIVISEMNRRLSDRMYLRHPRDPRARELADLFRDSRTVHLPVSALCRQAGLSQRTAERLFERECGLSPARWRRLAVLSESLLGIAGGDSIEHAALAAGYESRSAFAEAFTQTFGFPPGHARGLKLRSDSAGVQPASLSPRTSRSQLRTLR